MVTGQSSVELFVTKNKVVYPFRWQIVANLQQFCMDRISAKYMNNSLVAVRLPIRKPGPHNSHGPVGTLK